MLYTPPMLIHERLAHKKPIFSFEFFPPVTAKGEQVLWRNLENLAVLKPDFVSVTYGAGGSTRTKTLELVQRIKRELGIEPMAHLTCVGSTIDELKQIIDTLGNQGIRNILALRGDPRRGETEFKQVPGGLRHANELVELIRQRGDFCIGAACYPEVHIEAKDASSDLLYLKQKVDAGVDFLISQLFFDNKVFFAFVERARQIGIQVPILPGIMPITNFTQIERFSQMCGATIPEQLRQRLLAAEDDLQEIFWTGVSYAAYQCRELLEPERINLVNRESRGVHGIHFYTLNKSPATRAIFEILQLSRAVV